MNLQLQRAFMHLVGFVPEKLTGLPAYADACEYIECPHYNGRCREHTICKLYTYSEPRAGFKTRVAVCHVCGRGFN